ncbi:MAG: hypothetical protein IT174_10740 [Acidobacteria bacterium]|nr:hypothetical protein [Acidobacteriota bacterium]
MANPASFTVNALSANGSIAQPAVQTIDTNGTVPIPAATPSDRLFLECVNSAANAIDVTVKGGVNPPSHLSRDLAVTIAATTGKSIIGPFESQRFTKADGSFDVQFQAASGAPNLAVRVYRLPKQI